MKPLIALLLTVTLAHTAAPPPKIPALDIRFTQKGYKTNPENFAVVCKSAAMALARHYPQHRFPAIRIIKANNGFPVKLDQRGSNGEAQIMVSLSNGFEWNRLAYQFAHEFTHVLVNHDQPSAGPNHWLNEAFCEAVSYHALKVMAREWATHPPYRNWRSYAKHHASYADNYLKPAEKEKPDGQPFPQWFQKNENALRLGKRYPKYGLYKYVSYQLYKLIKQDPQLLGALGHLNFGLKNPAITTRQYLARWKTVLPASKKKYADQVATIFGYRLP